MGRRPMSRGNKSPNRYALASQIKGLEGRIELLESQMKMVHVELDKRVK